MKKKTPAAAPDQENDPMKALLLERGLELGPHRGWVDAKGDPRPELSTEQAARQAHAWRRVGVTSDDVLAGLEALDEALLTQFPEARRDVFGATKLPPPLRALTFPGLKVGDWLAGALQTCLLMRDVRAVLVHMAATFSFIRNEEQFLAVAPRINETAAPVLVTEEERWLLEDDPRPPELE